VKTGNYITALLLFFLAIAVWALTKNFPTEVGNIPGPAFFPRALATVLIVLVVLMLIDNRRVKNEPLFDYASPGFKRAMAMLALTTTYVLLVEYIGFLILTPICLLGMMWLMERKSFLMKIFAAVVSTASLYVVFEVLLVVPLPAWSL